ncbi:MAG: helix-turn-helix transcriptional regulator [Nonomuraea sp.]|nr:helix-turn-helix transcriptional regulator [Nonomuraea sp.]
MARPRTFDEGTAVEAAMRAFWRAGYEATSTADLCEATGLGRSSIYNTFAGKHDLFERALTRYMEVKDGELEEVLEGDLPPLEKVRVLLWQAVDEPLGCLVVNSMVELAPHDEVVAGLLRRNEGRRFSALLSVLGDEAKVRFVMSTITGLRVVARGGAGRDELEQIAGVALRAL